MFKVNDKDVVNDIILVFLLLPLNLSNPFLVFQLLNLNVK